MPTTHADKAKLLQERAYLKYNKSRYAGKENLKKDFLKEAYHLYSDAIEEWNREAWENSEYPRVVKFAKLNAEHNKELAQKIQDKLHGSEKGGLEKRFIFAIASIISLVGALLSVSFNLTGYAIGALSYNKISLAGGALFILGLVFTFLFLRSKNK